MEPHVSTERFLSPGLLFTACVCSEHQTVYETESLPLRLPLWGVTYF